MEQKKPVSLLVVILNCLCAVLWTTNCFIQLREGSVRTLDVVNAVVWSFCGVVWLLRYWSYKKREKSEGKN